MANTVSIDALRPELWKRELFQDVIDNLSLSQSGLVGSGNNNVVVFKDGLMKERGDGINLPLTVKLSGNGVTGDSELEGNEEAISAYSERIAIDQIRHAVRLTGLYDEQINSYDMRMDAKDKLAIWFSEFIERQFALKLGGVTYSASDLNDVNGVAYAGRATWSNTPDIYPAADEAAGSGDRYLCADSAGLDSLLATDVITPSLINRARTKALMANPKVVPLRVDGKKVWVMLVHPWVADDLRVDSTYSQAQREAQLRGKDNPIWSGSLGKWGSVALIEWEYTPSITGDGTLAFGAAGTAVPSGVKAFRNLLCGQQAVGFARAKTHRGFVEKEFDYGNQMGFASAMIGGVQKVMFNSLEYGVIAVDTGATDQ